MMLWRPLVIPLLLAMTLACERKAAFPDNDLECAPGTIDDDGTCVPEACGAGAWGNLATDDATVYVDIAASEDGDGSEAAPFTSIQAGLDTAGQAGGGTVAVAAGTYAEAIAITNQHDGVHLAGRCSDLVVLDGSSSGEVPAVDVTAGPAEVGLSRLSVTGGITTGIRVHSGTVVIEEASIRANGIVGLFVSGDEDAPTSVTVERSSITGSLPDSTGTYGYAVVAAAGAHISMHECTLAGNANTGLVASDADTLALVEDCTISGTMSNAKNQAGYGVLASANATVTMYRTSVVDNDGMGLVAMGGDLTCEDGEVSGHQAGVAGYGAYVGDGSTVVLRRTHITDNRDIGVALDGGNTILEDCEVSRTAGGATSDGVYVNDETASVGILRTSITDNTTGGLVVMAGEVVVEECDIARNGGNGVWAANSESAVMIEDCTISETLANAKDLAGYGVSVSTGATVAMYRTFVVDNDRMGIVLTGGEVVVKECEIARNVGNGVWAGNSESALTIENTIVQDTMVHDDGTGGQGMQVGYEAVVDVVECMIERNAKAGILVVYDGMVTLEDTTVRDNLPDANGWSGRGIEVQYGGQITANNCLIEGNHGVGVLAFDEGSLVSLDACVVSSTHMSLDQTVGIGVAVLGWASLQASDISVTANDGPGLYSVAESSLTCTRCDLLGNQIAGAINQGAILTLIDSYVSGTTAGANLGGGVGVLSTTYEYEFGALPATLNVTGSQIEDNPIAGIHLSGGTAILSNNIIKGGLGEPYGTATRCGDAVFADGMPAWNGTEGIALSGNTLSEALQAGLFLRNASALLQENAYSSNGIDLIRQGDGCESLPEGWEGTGSTETCPTWDYVTCPLEFSTRFLLSEVEF